MRHAGITALEFYQRMIPMADQLYDVYLQEVGKEGLTP
jgi:hypothetical protein